MRTALIVILWVALAMANDMHGKIKLRTMNRLQHHRSQSQTLPEPCYPPPCPGFNYNHQDAVTQDALISLPGDTSVDNGNGGMNVNGNNAGSPTIPMDSNDPTFSERPQGYVIMLPAPPIPLSNDDDADPDCCNDGEGSGPSPADIKSEKEDMKRVAALSQKIELKDISLTQHDNWIADAKNAIEKVNEHLKQAQTSRDSIANSIDSLKTRKDEIENKYKVDRLKRKLDVAKKTLDSLQTEEGGLNAAGSGLDAAQKNIEAKVSLLAEKLNIQRDQAEAKAKEFDKANQKLTSVLANFEQYSPDHIAL